MKQPEDRVTVDWVGGETGKGGGGMRSLADMRAEVARLADKIKRSAPRGAYAGAVKIGAPNHAARARTKLSQAEFAALAGVSERTLRTWESGEPVSQASAAKITAQLAALGQALAAPRRPVRYRDPMTGDTWSGRGLQPAWLRAKLQAGARLADFELGAPDPHRASINAAAQRAARSAGPA